MEVEEIKQRMESFLESAWREDWMDDADYAKLLNYSLKVQNKTLDDFVDMILVGVNNGHSVDKQFELMNAVFIKTK